LKCPSAKINMKLLSHNKGVDHGTAAKTEAHAIPWDKGKLLGPKAPLKLKEILL